MGLRDLKKNQADAHSALIAAVVHLAHATRFRRDQDLEPETQKEFVTDSLDAVCDELSKALEIMNCVNDDLSDVEKALPPGALAPIEGITRER